MSALQNRHPNPNPTLNPYPNPNPNPNPNPKTAPLANPKPLTFDQVSKFFSLPLSDAADSLGVCTNVLKKICHDNGLVRWPYRKYLSGKSIEQIKEDAARAKNKQLNEVPKDAGQISDASANSTVPLRPGSQLQNKTTSSVQGASKTQSVMLLQGNQNLQIANTQKLQGSNMTKGTPANFDEFKYGFPSDGLSTNSYKWWGNSITNGTKDSPGDVSQDIQGNKKSPINSADGTAIASTTDGEKCQHKTDESSNIDSLGTGLLSSLRKRAVNEGRDALKLGVHRTDPTSKLDRTKRSVLVQIFKSSLPSELGDASL